MKKHLASAAILLVLAVPAFSQTMIAFDHNEHMYVTAARLIQEGEAIYQDFSFVQMPYLPMLLSGLYAVTQTTHYLVVGKLLSFSFLILSVLVLYRIAWKRSGSAFLALALSTLILIYQIVLRAASESSNYIMPLACSLVSYLLYIEFADVDRPVRRRIGMGGSGLILALAIGARLVYALMIPAFLLVMLYSSRYQRPGKRDLTDAMAFLAGLLVGLLPALALLLRNPSAFLFNNVGYHLLNATLYDLTGYERAMTFPEKMEYASSVFVLGDNIALILALALYLVLSLTSRSNHAFVKQASATADLAGLILLSTIFGIFVATPTWPQYFAMPFPFVLVLMSCLYPRFSMLGKRVAGIANCAVIAVVFFIHGSGMIELVRYTNQPSFWSGVTIHRQAHRIKRNIGPLQEGDRVATLSPLYAIEAGLPIYNELASGPFAYRVGGLLTPAQREAWRVTAPEMIDELFDRQPPRAILVGFEKELDLSLEHYAQSHNFMLVPKDFTGGRLYVCCPD